MYRTAVNNAIADWNLAPTAFGTSWPSWRKKSAASTNAVARLQAIMHEDPVYDDRLVALVEWLLGRGSYHAETQLTNGSRLHTTLTSRLSSNPAARLSPVIKFQDFSWFRLWTVTGTPTSTMMFSSHGIYVPDQNRENGHPLTFRPTYTYHFYCDPGASLKYTVYRDEVLPSALSADVLSRRTVDSSNETENLALLCLEGEFFRLTIKTYTDHIKKNNIRELGFLSINKPDQLITFRQLDKELLPAIKWPVQRPIHMIVCRATV